MRFLQPWAFALAFLPLGILLLGMGRERRLLGRALSLGLLALALAQPELALRREKGQVMFLVDRSASVGDEAFQVFWDLAGTAVKQGMEVGIVVFAKSAALVRLPKPGLPQDLAVPVDLMPEHTDLGSALELALALLAGKGEIVLLSDGRDREGNLWRAVARARAQGIPVHVFPVGQEDVLRLVSFQGPEAVPVGTQAELKGVFVATRPLTVEAQLFRDGQLLERRTLAVGPGRGEIAFLWSFSDEGPRSVELFLNCLEDPVSANNRLGWIVQVGQAPEVLVVGEEAGFVDAALSSLGLAFRRRDSLSLLDLNNVDLVILDDHPLGLLGPESVEALRAFVEEGGGLFVVQGKRALAGYAGAIEEILPVAYAVPERMEWATAAVIFVLDRSASMAGRAGSTTKIELLKEATAAAVEFVPPEDWLGAIAFDRTPFWLAVPGPARETAPTLFSALAGLTPSGGTDLWPAVLLALSALENVPARIRHMILISDGKTVRENRDFGALYKRVAQSGVGLTAVAIGPDADLEVLGGLAQAGGGELHLLTDLRELRAVLVQETKRALRSRFVEGEFPIHPGPAALASEVPPPVHGYVLTFPKPAAEVAWILPSGDPLLAFWQVGLGKVAVLNTDLRGGWTRAWAQDPSWLPHFSALVAELWPMRTPVQVFWEAQGQDLLIRLDVAEKGRWLNGLRFRGELSGPTGLQQLEFHQVAPGRYEATIIRPGTGPHLLSFAEETGRFGGSLVLSVPYPAEYAELGPDRDTLQVIAQITGGKILEDEEIPGPRDLVEHWLPLWPALLWAGAAAVLLDLVWRKLLTR